jgi:3-deoxy-D-manno-octulosonate 8-phosphate phosphatase (KDO 8-P phosphatase)
MCIISGGTNKNIRKRFESLGIKEIHLGSENKIEQLNSFIKKYNIDKKNILFMGDDIPDIPILKTVGLPCCPQDATPEVKKLCSYVSHKNGGMGAVRDVIEQVMKIQNNWAK